MRLPPRIRILVVIASLVSACAAGDGDGQIEPDEGAADQQGQVNEGPISLDSQSPVETLDIACPKGCGIQLELTAGQWTLEDAKNLGVTVLAQIELAQCSTPTSCAARSTASFDLAGSQVRYDNQGQAILGIAYGRQPEGNYVLKLSKTPGQLEKISLYAKLVVN
jgi:hypothetical protein